MVDSNEIKNRSWKTVETRLILSCSFDNTEAACSINTGTNGSFPVYSLFAATSQTVNLYKITDVTSISKSSFSLSKLNSRIIHIFNSRRLIEKPLRPRMVNTARFHLSMNQSSIITARMQRMSVKHQVVYSQSVFPESFTTQKQDLNSSHSLSNICFPPSLYLSPETIWPDSTS